MKTIKKFLVPSLLICASAVTVKPSFADAVGRIFAQPERILRAAPERLYTNSLVGKTITRPVTVQGRGSTTVVWGSTVVNPGMQVSRNLVEIKCPSHGHRIIFMNTRVISTGSIYGNSSPKSNSPTGVVVHDCARRFSSHITSENNKITNLGTVTSD